MLIIKERELIGVAKNARSPPKRDTMFANIDALSSDLTLLNRTRKNADERG
jgi:hypothetical protein